MNQSTSASSKASIFPPPAQPKPYPSQQPFMAPHLSPHHMHRPIFYPRPSGAGAEPGVNPREGAQFTQYRSDCLIDIIDFDADDVSIERVGNADFIRMMKDQTTDDDHPRAVRWINIAGIDWEVLSSMALRYHIHALALEDVLHDRGDIQSKADYYPDHMFIRVLCHSVLPNDDQNHIDLSDPRSHFRYGAKRRSYRGNSGPPAYKATEFENIESGRTQPLPFKASRPGLSRWGSTREQEQAIKLNFLTRGDRLNIHHDPMCIFLFLDGTVISLMPTSNLNFTAPITERLYNNRSILRVSEDPSLLMEALLDLVVDRVLDVVDAYQAKIHSLEHDIILNPNMDAIRSLHVLSGDLIMHKLMLEPIKTLIYNLREQDAQRCMTIAEQVKTEIESPDSHGSDSDSDPGSGTAVPVEGRGKDASNEPGQKESIISTDTQKPEAGRSNGFRRQQGISVEERNKRKSPRSRRSRRCKDATEAEKSRWKSAWRLRSDGTTRGYLSYTTKIYLGDVADHMDFAMTSIDMFAGVSDNLVNYAFNVASYETNRVMSRLTVVTIIFLPPSLLTGYYGMGFNPFPGLDGHSVVLFWEIVLPVMAVVIPLFMYHEVSNTVKSVISAWNVRKVIRG